MSDSVLMKLRRRLVTVATDVEEIERELAAHGRSEEVSKAKVSKRLQELEAALRGRSTS